MSVPPGYNPAASMLSGGQDQPILPVQGGGGMNVPPGYNYTASLLKGGLDEPIVGVQGGGAFLASVPQPTEIKRVPGFGRAFSIRIPNAAAVADWKSLQFTEDEAEFLNKIEPGDFVGIFESPEEAGEEVAVFLQNVVEGRCTEFTPYQLSSNCFKTRKILKHIRNRKEGMSGIRALFGMSPKPTAGVPTPAAAAAPRPGAAAGTTRLNVTYDMIQGLKRQLESLERRGQKDTELYRTNYTELINLINSTIDTYNRQLERRNLKDDLRRRLQARLPELGALKAILEAQATENPLGRRLLPPDSPAQTAAYQAELDRIAAEGAAAPVNSMNLDAAKRRTRVAKETAEAAAAAAAAAAGMAAAGAEVAAAARTAQEAAERARAAYGHFTAAAGYPAIRPSPQEAARFVREAEEAAQIAQAAAAAANPRGVPIPGSAASYATPDARIPVPVSPGLGPRGNVGASTRRMATPGNNRRANSGAAAAAAAPAANAPAAQAAAGAAATAAAAAQQAAVVAANAPAAQAAAGAAAGAAQEAAQAAQAAQAAPNNRVAAPAAAQAQTAAAAAQAAAQQATAMAAGTALGTRRNNRGTRVAAMRPGLPHTAFIENVAPTVGTPRVPGRAPSRVDSSNAIESALQAKRDALARFQEQLTVEQTALGQAGQRFTVRPTYFREDLTGTQVPVYINTKNNKLFGNIRRGMKFYRLKADTVDQLKAKFSPAALTAIDRAEARVAEAQKAVKKAQIDLDAAKSSASRQAAALSSAERKAAAARTRLEALETRQEEIRAAAPTAVAEAKPTLGQRFKSLFTRSTGGKRTRKVNRKNRSTRKANRKASRKNRRNTTYRR